MWVCGDIIVHTMGDVVYSMEGCVGVWRMRVREYVRV